MLIVIIKAAITIFLLVCLAMILGWVREELRPLPLSKAVYQLKHILSLPETSRCVYKRDQYTLFLSNSKVLKIYIFEDHFITEGRKFGTSLFEIKRLVRYINEIDLV